MILVQTAHISASRFPSSAFIFGPAPVEAFSAGENPTQALQLPHVAEQGEQTQKKDETPEDGDLEFWPLRDKHKAENSSWKDINHARQKQNNVTEQRVLELR